MFSGIAISAMPPFAFQRRYDALDGTLRADSACCNCILYHALVCCNYQFSKHPLTYKIGHDLGHGMEYDMRHG